MPICLTTLEGLDLGRMEQEFQKASASGLSGAYCEFWPTLYENTSGGGEHILASIASWIPSMLAAHFHGSVREDQILNAIACGADLVLLDHETYTRNSAMRILSCGALLGVAVPAFDIQTDIPAGCSAVAAPWPFDQSATGTQTRPRNSIQILRAMRGKAAPQLAIGLKVERVQSIQEATGPDLGGIDFIALDYFAPNNHRAPAALARRVPGLPPHSPLKKALPSGLRIKRDVERLRNLFEGMGAVPPKRRKT
jgi:hypothetical protein